MRVMFSIAKLMVHAVHNAISPWDQVRRALEKPGAEIKHTLPSFARIIHLVRSISMQEKCMKEQ